MDTSKVSSNVSAVQNSSGVQSNSNFGQVDKNGFLKILAAELQNQNPMNAQDNTQYIAQMAQLSALEQMQNLNQSFQNLSMNIKFQEGSSMLGKNATVAVGDNLLITGVVSGVKLTDGTVKIVIGDSEYDIDSAVGLDDAGGVSNAI